MILPDAALNVRSSGIQTKQFGIALSREMFSILSSGIYSDKIKAVVRELSTNAADAHVAAGKPTVPFEVHLPSMMEPWFAVKDMGTGLSTEEMASIYTQYGVSNKRDTNEQTGCLGLGSKSPFAYTDSFTVESRYQGKLYTYTAYLNADGCPSLSDPMTITDTAESNGLTVKFSVRNNDFREFAEKAKSVLRWFKVRPVVSGNREFLYPAATDYIIENEKYAITKAHTGCSYCLMGNVAYPIDVHAAVSYSVKGSSNLRALLEYGIVLKVALGEVDFTTSRESLTYGNSEGKGKRTVATIQRLLIEAIKDMETVVTKDISTKATAWEAGTALLAVRQRFPWFNFKAQWQGQEVKTSFDLPKGVESWKPNTYSANLKVRQSGALHATPFEDPTPMILIDSKSSTSIIRNYLKSNKKTVLVFPEDTDLKWFHDLGIEDKLLRTSTMPKPIRAVGVRSTNEKTLCYTWERAAGAAADCWKAAEVDSEDDGQFIYVEILRYKLYKGEGVESGNPSIIGYLIEKILKLIGKKIVVYGVRPADKHKLEKTEGNWISLTEYVKDIVSSFKANFAKEIQYNQQAAAVGYCSLANRYRKAKGVEKTTLGEYVKAYDEASTGSKSAKFATLCRLAEYVNDPIVIKEDDTLVKMRDEIYRKYPLLQWVSSVYNDDEQKLQTEALVRYLAAIDGK